MIQREDIQKRLDKSLRRSPVVLLAGPRQYGKTTLARGVSRRRKNSHYFDLESPADIAALSEPMTALEGLVGLVVLDEVQRRPEIFPVLRVLADRRPVRTRFLDAKAEAATGR